MSHRFAACVLLLITLAASAFGQGAGTAPGAPESTTGPQTKRQTKIIRLGGNAAAKNLVSQVPPEYPEEAKAAHISGTVLLHVVISTDGSVQLAEYVSGPMLLKDSAINAVLYWRYKPTLLNGSPVEVDTTVSIFYSQQGSVDTHIDKAEQSHVVTSPMRTDTDIVSSSETQNIHLSDRENAGLRGSVSTVIEETATTEYSRDGKLLTPKTPSLSELEVRYEQGVKTTIQTFDSRTTIPLNLDFGPSSETSLWDLAARGSGVPKGGSIAILYDADDQATELQIRSADGTVIYKFVRTYNANGRVIEEKMILENPAAFILSNRPEVDRDKMSPEELRRYIVAEKEGSKSYMIAAEGFMLRGKAQMGVFYTFDEQNHLTKIVQRGSIIENTTTIIYNGQGDKVEERTTFADNSAFPSGVLFKVDETGTPVPIDPDAKPNPPAMVREGYSVRYVYKYDGFGNWLQRIRIVSLDSGYEESFVRNRKISYYQP